MSRVHPRSWRNVWDHRWSYVARLPMLPEQKLARHTARLFQTRFRNWDNLPDVNVNLKFDLVRYCCILLVMFDMGSTKHIHTRKVQQLSLNKQIN